MSLISVIAELENYGIEYDWATEHEVKCRCPFHDDNSPSCFVNVEKRAFKCQTAGCGKSGDIISLLARFLKTSREVVFADLSTRYEFDTSKIIDVETVEKFHRAIWEAKPFIKELHDRGITDDLIRKYRLGEHQGRITIPIKNEGGLYVNIRRYLPGAPGPEKMKNLRGHGKIRLYPIDQLAYDQILICGGEMKAVAAADELNKHNIGAISATCGEDNWDVTLSKAFTGKKVWVCNDIDEAGQESAKMRCAMVRHQARWCGNLMLPLDPDKYPKGDINDYVAIGGKLKPLLDACEEWKPEGKLDFDPNEIPEDSNLTTAVLAENTGKRIKLTSVVSAMDTAPYSIPKQIEVLCSQDQKVCPACPVMLTGEHHYSINEESDAVLEMVGGSKRGQRECLMSAVGIPRRCGVCEFDITDYHNVEDVRISPQLEITNRSSDRVMQPAYCIGQGLELNESYEMIGRMWPHPSSQQATLLISKYETTQDALSTYELNNPERLKIFQCDDTVEAIEQKLNEIYDDLEANVTRIFQRRDLHKIVDLTYHSPLLIDFDGRTVKGWVESLIMGDSSQGKSETTQQLMKHYGLGEKVECKNASVAGLLGGLQQMGNKWFVSWGIIPTHDKRLVVLEELKGASIDVISKLTDMRSSGVAEIPKIEKRKTSARTRLIALSNPRSDHPLHTYNFGIEAIKELVGGLEDVRRFDIFGLVSAKEINAAKLNELQSMRPHVEHIFTDSICRDLILWTWTRDKAYFNDAAKKAILEGATRLSEKFSDTLPIFDRGSGRLKIARLSAALAGRLFSHDDEYHLIVKESHVAYIVDMLDRMYSSQVFGYLDFTQAVKLAESLKDPEAVQKQIEASPFPRDFVSQMLHTNKIDLQDIQDWCGWDKGEAQGLLSFFVRKHCLMRDGRSYRKTGPFINLLKKLLEEGNLADRPDFIEEEF